MFKLKSIQEEDFPNWCISFQSYFSVYLKYTLNIDVFILKLRSILELDFLNLCIYLQTLKYTRSRLSILMYIFTLKLWSILEANFLNLSMYVQTLMYIRSRFPKYTRSRCILEVDFLNKFLIISFQTQKYTWSWSIYTLFQKKSRSVIIEV